jgi:hypothetical protein
MSITTCTSFETELLQVIFTYFSIILSFILQLLFNKKFIFYSIFIIFLNF